MSKYHLSASILSADFSQLGADAQAALDAGMDAIHFDVMDHHYVPNLSFGAMPCRALRNYGITAEIDVHLMVTDPAHYLIPFAEAGASRLTFHPETVDDPAHLVREIHAAGMEAGLAFNPDQPVDISDALLPELDLILFMSVFPGFGGQSFIPSVLDKIQPLRDRLAAQELSPLLAIDGGIKVDNIHQAVQAGANYMVLGSGFFSADHYEARVAALRTAMEG
jgi:ribulose-phosphate 3-epimerase